MLNIAKIPHISCLTLITTAFLVYVFKVVKTDGYFVQNTIQPDASWSNLEVKEFGKIKSASQDLRY